MGSLSIEVARGEEEFDVVIIGAGLSGLYAARAYLEIQPSIKLVVVESLGSVGGVWSKERIYPGLNVQTAPEYFELPEFRYKEMDPPPEYNGKEFITGPSYSRYIEAWTERVGLNKYIRLNTTIRQITRHEDGVKWRCHIANDSKLVAEKLIVANGITSLPKYPDFDGSKFNKPAIHHRFFGERRTEWDNESVKNVTVYGGGKGAMDNIVALVKAGKKVKWVIRKEGRGPVWIMDSRLPNGERAENMGFCRVPSIVMPSLYRDERFSGLHYFFKQNFIGRWIAKLFMNGSKFFAMQQLKPLTENVKRAAPEIAPFWMYHVIGVDNYDIKVYDSMRNGSIEVVRDTMTGLEGDSVVLASGDKFETDAVIFATGWKASVSLFSENLELEMNLGLPSTSYTDEYLQKWKKLEEEADGRVFSDNPILKDAPEPPRIPPQESGPFRLYHYTVPTEFADRSIAFLGVAPTPATTQYAMVMGLWTAAYMAGKLDLPSKEEMEQTTAYELRFTQIRHVGLSNEFPLITFDWLAIASKFMIELGIDPYTKGGYFSEIFGAYMADDFVDLYDRWIKKHGIVGKPRDIEA
ncbi:hypothetical protein TWF694_004465 [Orbilia ellipsospora]|uniref:Flavin-containing monooxygenase n=1 Tax=Orbilia ellipsospora TaxID=2528407 RepID=A0AAV9WWB4_9PEZI